MVYFAKSFEDLEKLKWPLSGLSVMNLSLEAGGVV